MRPGRGPGHLMAEVEQAGHRDEHRLDREEDDDEDGAAYRATKSGAGSA